MKKVLLTTVMSLMMCMGVYAQTEPNYMASPKIGEKVIGTISKSFWLYHNDNRSQQEFYDKLLVAAKKEYSGINIDIREMNCHYSEYRSNSPCYLYEGAGKVVKIIGAETHISESLSQSFNKALRNVREGSRMAIDQVSVPYTMDKEAIKDQIIDVLLDKDYKVVAKDYLERLYQEQQNQRSGIYNESTTVNPDNFSAVGYYINVKVTETSLRVQVVNVSTGEYEGNATVNF